MTDRPRNPLHLLKYLTAVSEEFGRCVPEAWTRAILRIEVIATGGATELRFSAQGPRGLPGEFVPTARFVELMQDYPENFRIRGVPVEPISWIMLMRGYNLFGWSVFPCPFGEPTAKEKRSFLKPVLIPPRPATIIVPPDPSATGPGGSQ